MFNNIEIIFWDFDGVIMDSMKVRDEGFEIVLKNYPSSQVEKLMAFHRNNGGLSRYVKFRYFFEVIRNENVSEENVKVLANKFSEVMINRLKDRNLLIEDSFDFIRDNHENFDFHIVSGSDGSELNYLCKELNISKYFISILGSPTPKTELVAQILSDYKYNKEECILIGDSINDYEAATTNGMDFYGYNNSQLKDLNNCGYIEKFGT